MLATEQLVTGNVRDSLAQLQDQIRKDPANPKLRIFLFQLLAVTGQWDRAVNQLNVLGEMDAGSLAMVQMYREALRCEVLRTAVFAGKAAPLVFGKPERWVALMIEALRVTAAGHHGEAQKLRDEAFDLAPATAGSLDGQAFEWLADADPRLGPVLELYFNRAYYWVPLHQIREIHVEEPADLRDVVWMPAHFVWANGGDAVGLIPTRYPGSEASEDATVQLARGTIWQEPSPGLYEGLGQRMLASDSADYALMDIRKILLESEVPAEPEADALAPEETDG